MSKHERIELNHIINEERDASLEEWHVLALTEVSGSIHQVSPRPLPLIEQEDAALRLLKEVVSGS